MNFNSAISKKNLIILLVFLVMMGIGISIFIISKKYISPASNTTTNTADTSTISQLPGCKVAFSPEIYSNPKGISEEAKSLIRHYRQSWQNLCLGKSNYSLYPLWIEAKTLTEFSVSEPLCKVIVEGECSVDITLFTPGIEGMFAEGMLQYFAPSKSLFSENVILGTKEDKDFFISYSAFYPDDNNSFPPWIKGTWDYGGCTNYGDYNWVENLKTLDELSTKIKSPVYLEDINLSRDKLLGNFNYGNGDYSIYEIPPKVCTCGKKEKVLDDFEKILQYLSSYPSYKDLIPMVNNTIVEIKNGDLKIFSEAEQHCSGG